MKCFCVEYQLSSISSMLLFFFSFCCESETTQEDIYRKMENILFHLHVQQCKFLLFVTIQNINILSSLCGFSELTSSSYCRRRKAECSPLSPQNIWWLTNGWVKCGIEFFWNQIFSLNRMSGGCSGTLCGTYITALQGGGPRGPVLTFLLFIIQRLNIKHCRCLADVE